MELHHLLNSIIPLKAFLLLISVSSQISGAANSDKIALLDLKSHLKDYPADAFSSWNDSMDFCMWAGVQCGKKHHRVTGIHLKAMNMYGHIPPSIKNLSFLQQIDLSQNSLTGIIPEELGHLTRLKNLNLSFNLLTGHIPENLSACFNLISLSLHHNSLTLGIPCELGSFSKLKILYLNNNNLTGTFPASLGNLSSLREVDVSYNRMNGEVPETVGKLNKLRVLVLSVNQFCGVFPPAIYNLSLLNHLSLALNLFYGRLKTDIASHFPDIQKLSLMSNNFTGEIPLSLFNATSLSRVSLAFNRFTGNIPSSLGNLPSLTFLNLRDNFFGNYSGDDLMFMDALANFSSLQFLDISMNQFGGNLKASVANLSSQLESLNVEGNGISGSVPEAISGLVGLTALKMGSNLFTGTIPASLGTLPRLQSLYLSQNLFTGRIPSSLGNLTQLLALYLYNNSFQGSLPLTFSNLKHLQDAKFSDNKLSGTIPPRFIALPSLTIALNLSRNFFTGPLPNEVGNLTSLTSLDVSYNHLSGDIPSGLGLCLSLTTLNMHNNLLGGSVPDLSRLKGLQYLDLSKNNLSGEIPDYLANFSSLMNLNLSFNNFRGNVPAQGVFKNETAVQVYGNINLCGGIPQLDLQPCPVKRSRRNAKLKCILPLVLIPSFMLLFLVIFFLHRKNLSRGKRESSSSFGRVYRKISYKELHDATRGFCPDNLIGVGSFGSVYVGILGQGEVAVAIKVLDLHQWGASKSFVAECRALGSIRHRNLVRILTVCSGVDYGGNDFKALMYPYMQNGSLDKWLHPEDGGTSLNLVERINVAIDVASALHYLHHQCQFPIIHCDLKPSNVLLDGDLTAHVSDFGLARLLPTFGGEFSSLGIKGTLGYIAPEYGMGRPVSILGDVYSYGILLLELFTGRRPVDEGFQDKFNLHNFVKMALLDEVAKIMDESKLLNQEVEGAHLNKEMMIDCFACVLKIGVACSAEDPQERTNMAEVVHQLVSVKEKFIGRGREKWRMEWNP